MDIAWTAAGIAALATAAGAGTVTLGTSAVANTAAQQLADYTGSMPVVQSGLTAFSGASPSFSLTFGTLATGEADSNLGNFYLGTGSGLASSGTGNWFNNVAGGAGALASDTVMAFGNSGFSAREVTIDFQPGVAGFIFNFSDVGDVSNAELVVTWSDGSTTSAPTSTSNQVNGYISLLAGAGQTIQSVTLNQDPIANDGFLFYGFSTMAVVPLPPAAWAGLAMLGGIAGVRVVRRRG